MWACNPSSKKKRKSKVKREDCVKLWSLGTAVSRTKTLNTPPSYGGYFLVNQYPKKGCVHLAWSGSAIAIQDSYIAQMFIIKWRFLNRSRCWCLNYQFLVLIETGAFLLVLVRKRPRHFKKRILRLYCLINNRFMVCVRASSMDARWNSLSTREMFESHEAWVLSNHPMAFIITHANFEWIVI